MDQGDENVTDIIDIEDQSGNFNGMKIVQISIGTMGIITNIIVIIVFLNDRKLRKKIPNICIINQVCIYILTSSKRKVMRFQLIPLIQI